MASLGHELFRSVSPAVRKDVQLDAEVTSPLLYGDRHIGVHRSGQLSTVISIEPNVEAKQRKGPSVVRTVALLGPFDVLHQLVKHHRFGGGWINLGRTILGLSCR